MCGAEEPSLMSSSVSNILGREEGAKGTFCFVLEHKWPLMTLSVRGAQNFAPLQKGMALGDLERVQKEPKILHRCRRPGGKGPKAQRTIAAESVQLRDRLER